VDTIEDGMTRNDSTAKRQRKIGILVGREWSWPPAFIEEVNRRNKGVTAEFVELGTPSLDGLLEYDVVVDRISHEVPFYRSWLKHAQLRGVRVINSPLMWTADDKFFGATLAERLDVRSPKTMLLPNKEYIPGIKHDESLRNLAFPLDWQAVVEHIGMPCILKDAHGGGWRDVYVCRSLDELLHHYNESGLLTMIVQEFIEWDEFVRCICIGRDEIAPIKYDPKERKYHDSEDFLPPARRREVIKQARKLVRALGYDMNSIEFAIKDGVPYAIDFMNPAPDFDINSLGPKWFEWAVHRMADMTIDMALQDVSMPKPRASALFRNRVRRSG
jgi:glutathione synthase/RimK-type ligase-like ATP-grasp enzyme